MKNVIDAAEELSLHCHSQQDVCHKAVEILSNTGDVNHEGAIAALYGAGHAYRGVWDRMIGIVKALKNPVEPSG